MVVGTGNTGGRPDKPLYLMKAALAYRLGVASRRSRQFGELVRERHADGSIVIVG